MVSSNARSFWRSSAIRNCSGESHAIPALNLAASWALLAHRLPPNQLGCSGYYAVLFWSGFAYDSSGIASLAESQAAKESFCSQCFYYATHRRKSGVLRGFYSSALHSDHCYHTFMFAGLRRCCTFSSQWLRREQRGRCDPNCK